MIEDEDDDSWSKEWKSTVDKRLKKKYARAMEKFRWGIWGQDMNMIVEIVLTTKEGVKNSWKDIVRDNRHLREGMRKDGYKYDDCLCGEVTPLKGLHHLHGLVRFREKVDLYEFNRKLSERWELYHGAKIVYVSPVYYLKGLLNYNVKHILKNYVENPFSRVRILRSKGWLPEGYKEDRKSVV